LVKWRKGRENKKEEEGKMSGGLEEGRKRSGKQT